MTIGELRRGIERVSHRHDLTQAEQLEHWLQSILQDYQDNILTIDSDTAQIWGKLRVPYPENELDKLISATALIYDLILVTRNISDFQKTGVKLLSPFQNTF
ncbi:type II toxin-antitoxin system VapC family toxin [uncultured Thiothrix sp.]|uniref:type II toxin-antitoxin system VapC family toxin n=1 Tax=uncultured Thiothrix sp. TaxID=223185 RepID=UPI00345C96F4